MAKRKPLNVLITAGPTREYLDPVRFLTNASSGRMGLEIASAFRKKGCRTTIVSGPEISAVQMSRQVKKKLSSSDVFVAAAAVSDYRAARPKRTKMKKSAARLRLELIRNPDILADAGNWKKKRKSMRPLLVGFALETGSVAKEAAKKLKNKNLDLIIGNRPESFASSFIRPFWLEKNKKGFWLPKMSKKTLANKIAGWTRKIYGR